MTLSLSDLRVMQRPRIGVVIPVYGDSDSVCWVLRRFRTASVNMICLVIDVPLKRVMDKIREAAKQTGIAVHIIKNARRTGIGSSLRQGLQYLLDNDYHIAVIMAANGKDDPVEIDRIIGPVAKSQADYVQGSRYLPGGRKSGMPLRRIILTRLYPFLWTLLTGKKCTDVTNGYRCYRLEILRDSRVNLHQGWLDGYCLEYYLHYKVLTLGYRVREVPVSKTYPFDQKGRYSKIQPLRDWWQIVSPLILLSIGVKK